MHISEQQTNLLYPLRNGGVKSEKCGKPDEARIMECIAKGQAWLERNKGAFTAETENGISFDDNFVGLLILELSQRWDYVNLRIPARRWNYFGGKPVIVPEDYPDDNDTNAVAYSVLKPTKDRAKDIMDEMLRCENKDGVIQVHLDLNRPRVAPEVSANILTLFYTFGRGHEVQASLRYLQAALEETEYEESRYYFMPEPLFYYVWRLIRVAASPSCPVGSLAKAFMPKELQRLRERLITRVQARIGAETDNALCAAIRLLISRDLGLEDYGDLQTLLSLQDDDGSFGPGWYVRYGSCGIKISHRAFACVMAMEALRRSFIA